MSRLVLLAIIALAAALYLPGSRPAVLRVANPALAPVYRWQSLLEMEKVANEVQAWERENYGRLPEPRRFSAWLAESLDDARSRDAWGSPYTLTVEPDSFAILSWGPDQLARTDDDLRVARRRMRR